MESVREHINEGDQITLLCLILPNKSRPNKKETDVGPAMFGLERDSGKMVLDMAIHHHVEKAPENPPGDPSSPPIYDLLGTTGPLEQSVESGRSSSTNSASSPRRLYFCLLRAGDTFRKVVVLFVCGYIFSKSPGFLKGYPDLSFFPANRSCLCVSPWHPSPYRAVEWRTCRRPKRFREKRRRQKLPADVYVKIEMAKEGYRPRLVLTGEGSKTEEKRKHLSSTNATEISNLFLSTLR